MVLPASSNSARWRRCGPSRSSRPARTSWPPPAFRRCATGGRGSPRSAGSALGTLLWGFAGAFGVHLHVLRSHRCLYAALTLHGRVLPDLHGRADHRSEVFARRRRVSPAARPALGPAFRLGLLTSLSNPKSALFVARVVRGGDAAGRPLGSGLVAVAEMVAISVLWYALVVCLLTTRRGGRRLCADAALDRSRGRVGVRAVRRALVLGAGHERLVDRPGPRRAAAPPAIADTITEFPDGTRTAADAAAAIGCKVAQIAKSIVFRAGEQAAVVIASGRQSRRREEGPGGARRADEARRRGLGARDHRLRDRRRRAARAHLAAAAAVRPRPAGAAPDLGGGRLAASCVPDRGRNARPHHRRAGSPISARSSAGRYFPAQASPAAFPSRNRVRHAPKIASNAGPSPPSWPGRRRRPIDQHEVHPGRARPLCRAISARPSGAGIEIVVAELHEGEPHRRRDRRPAGPPKSSIAFGRRLGFVPCAAGSIAAIASTVPGTASADEADERAARIPRDDDRAGIRPLSAPATPAARLSPPGPSGSALGAVEPPDVVVVGGETADPGRLAGGGGRVPCRSRRAARRRAGRVRRAGAAERRRRLRTAARLEYAPAPAAAAARSDARISRRMRRRAGRRRGRDGWCGAFSSGIHLAVCLPRRRAGTNIGS